MNFYTIRINKLLELDPSVPDEDWLKPIVPVEKYVKSTTVTKAIAKPREPSVRQGSKKNGKTLIAGYINRYNQENKGCSNK